MNWGKLLHYRERILTAAEAFLIHHHVNLLKLSYVGGGQESVSLERALKIYCGRIRKCQHEAVGLIAFDNTAYHESCVIRQVVQDATNASLMCQAMGDFDCVTGENAEEFKQLFSLASWGKIEQKAMEYTELAC